MPEQVEGYRAFYQIEELIALKEIQQYKINLNPICQPAKLSYWLTPVMRVNTLSTVKKKERLI